MDDIIERAIERAIKYMISQEEIIWISIFYIWLKGPRKQQGLR